MDSNGQLERAEALSSTHIRAPMLWIWCRGRRERLCDKHERPTVVRRDIHQTRLGVRSFRCPLRSRKRGCARSRSSSLSMQCCPLTIIGSAAYPMSFVQRALQGHGMDRWRPAGKPTAEGSEIMTWVGRPASLACGGDLPLKRLHGTCDLLHALSRPSRHAAVGWKKGLTP